MGAISDFLVVFSRDYGSYVYIEKDLRSLCEDALRGIQFLWQSRVKTVESLEKKVRGRSENYNGEAENVADIVDLVAGRIILADWGEFGRVEQILKDNFNLSGQVQHPKPGQKAVNFQSRFRGYGGRHFHVRRKRAADQRSNDAIDPVIEIQVMTAYMWAYATLAHDIEYKKLNGEPSEDLVLSLEALKGIANLGEIGLEMFNRQFVPVASRQSDPHLGLPNTIQTLEANVCLSESDRQCLRDIRRTDPRHDKERIESSKDQLLEGSCSWVLEDSAFLDWWNRDDSRLLWIHGDPGKGKTMMMMALISEVSQRLKAQPGSNVLTYFFCQNTSEDLNTTVAVLRGLIYFLVDQEKKLVRHIRKYHDGAGKDLFEGPNALHALLMILSDILKDHSLGNVCLMIDALDECDVKIHQLINWIVRREPSVSPRIKWLVTSRNEPAFTEQLGHNRHLHTSLELNSQHVARAVAAFIDYKVEELADLKSYEPRLQIFVRKSLREKAEDTFLWVALVCKELVKVRRQKVRSMLEKFPAGLIPLYGRMLRRVLDQQDQNDTELLRRILRTVTLAFRPLRFREVSIFAEMPIDEDVEKLVGSCGSFLTVREEIVYLVHQSAKDYLSDEDRKELFHSGKAHAHADQVLFCLKMMSNTLRKDICNLKMPGYCLSDITRNRMEVHIPLHVQYACLHWVDHLQQAGSASHRTLTLGEDCKVLGFFTKHFLHWVEALVLLKRMSEAILVVTSLGSLPESRKSSALSAFVMDAGRFLFEFRYIIEEAHLQIYSSALVFCPRTSIIKRTFSGDLPKWIDGLPNVDESWPVSLQTLHTDELSGTELIFSPDGQLLASAYKSDPMIRIWETSTGALRGTLNGPDDFDTDRIKNVERKKKYVVKMIFSSTHQLLISASHVPFVRIWDNVSGMSQDIVDDQFDRISAITFSPDARLLASASEKDFKIKLWDPLIGTSRGVLEGHTDLIKTMTFAAPNGQLLASGSDDKTIRVWDPNLGVARLLFGDHSSPVSAVVFSPPDGHILASVTVCGSTISLWDTSTEVSIVKLQVPPDGSRSILFTPNGQLLVSTSGNTISIWASATGASMGVIQIDEDLETACISPNSRLVAVASFKDVHLWDLTTRTKMSTFEGHSDDVKSLQFSLDSHLLATESDDCTIRLWDVDAPVSQSEYEGHISDITSLVFSPCGELFASGCASSGLRVWDSAVGTSRTLIDEDEDHKSIPDAITFSPDSQLLVVGFDSSGASNIRLWDPITGASRGVLEGHMGSVRAVIFSPDGRLLASGSDDNTIRLWNPKTGDSYGMLEALGFIESLAFSHDGQILASTQLSKDSKHTIKLWDCGTYAFQATLGDHPGGHAENITFSSDGQYLALAHDHTVEVWNIKSSSLCYKKDLYFGGNLCFNDEGFQLEVSGRLVPILPPLDDSDHGPVWTRSPYALDFTKEWVTFQGCEVLRLPSDRQPHVIAIHQNLLLLGTNNIWGTGNGIITLFRFSSTVAPPGIE